MCPHVTDQDHMESVFRDHLKRRFGVEVEMGMEVVGFEQDTDGVHVRVKNHTAGEEQSLHAQYLVGSDGGRSTVRKRLGLTFEGESLPDCMIYGDAIISGIDHKAGTHITLLDTR
jgi:2-polyprenyl-6-methoxyphenol hydroxylase-like FAD-dependent oxidoreductase